MLPTTTDLHGMHVRGLSGFVVGRAYLTVASVMVAEEERVVALGASTEKAATLVYLTPEQARELAEELQRMAGEAARR